MSSSPRPRARHVRRNPSAPIASVRRVAKVADLYLREVHPQLEVTVTLGPLPGAERPHFQVTGRLTAERPRAKGAPQRVVLSEGAIHGTILMVFPELAPLIDVHMTDDRGVPFDIEGRAWDWLTQCWPDTPTVTQADNPIACFARLVHVSVAEATAEALRLEEFPIAGGARQQELNDWLLLQHRRWAVDATLAMVTLRQLQKTAPLD